MKTGPTLSISEALHERRIAALGSSEDVARAVQGIERLLRDRQFSPGDRLVEADLARTLGLGRGPIREALRILAGDGVVELSNNRGARIRAIDRTTLMQMMQVITSLFCLGADLFAARPRRQRAIDALRAMAQKIKAAAKRGDKHALNLHFIEYHQIVFHFSGNTYLSELFQRLHIAHYQSAVEIALGGRVLRDVAQAYDAITDALESADAAAAKAILIEQMGQIIGHMESGSESIDLALDSLVDTVGTETASTRSSGTQRVVALAPRQKTRARSARAKK